ncbi:MAG TPA: hypothetical protein VNO21_24175, partial [Polyangiaceae bacterium]|nr:hypothetical protein [Polyangiaceae bacterium]
MIAPQEMLTSEAVMVRATSEATKAATWPTSARVASRFSKVACRIEAVMASRGARAAGSDSELVFQ